MDNILLCLPIEIIKGLIDGEIKDIPWVIRHYLKPPFKVYAYCSSHETFKVDGILPRLFHIKDGDSAPYISEGIPASPNQSLKFEIINGKVPLSFICDKINELEKSDKHPFNYAWNVSELTILDKPMTLGQFKHRCPNKKQKCGKCKYKLNDSPLESIRCGANITQAPTPWCHIREV